MKKIVEIKNLKKIYKSGRKSITALRGISFSVEEGEVFGILGPNGAGKSTTLNILVGLLSPTSGEVRIFGQDFLKNESRVKERMNIATAYADLATNLTVYRNLKVFSMLYGVEESEKKIQELLSIFKIQELRDKKMDSLSAGQRTRVNLCKSLINDPELLLLDEPTAS